MNWGSTTAPSSQRVSCPHASSCGRSLWAAPWYLDGIWCPRFPDSQMIFWLVVHLPLLKILVSWDDYAQYMGKKNKKTNHQPVFNFEAEGSWWKLMESWWKVDGKLMESWWTVDGKLMENWWKIDGKLMAVDSPSAITWNQRKRFNFAHLSTPTVSSRILSQRAWTPIIDEFHGADEGGYRLVVRQFPFWSTKAWQFR